MVQLADESVLDPRDNGRFGDPSLAVDPPILVLVARLTPAEIAVARLVDEHQVPPASRLLGVGLDDEVGDDAGAISKKGLNCSLVNS